MKKLSISKTAFSALYAIFVIAILLLPKYVYGLSYMQNIILSAPLFLWAFLWDQKFLKKFVIIVGILGVISAFRFCFNTGFHFGMAVNLAIVSYVAFIPYFTFESLANAKQIEKNVVIFVAFVLFAYVMINTWKEFAVNPTVARLLARGTQDDVELQLLRDSNVGGFGFSYAVGMFAPYVALWITRTTGIKKACFILLEIILLVYCVYTQYTTLILFAVVFSALIFFLKTKNRVMVILIALFAVLALLYLEDIFYLLGSKLQLKSLSEHLMGIASFLGGGDIGSSRGELATNALKLFITDPIVGVDLTDSRNLYIVNHSHSTYTGILPSGGIVGFGLYACVLFLIVRNIITKMPSGNDILPVLLMYIILGAFNPITLADITVAVLLIIPLCELAFVTPNEKGRIS